MFLQIMQREGNREGRALLKSLPPPRVAPRGAEFLGGQRGDCPSIPPMNPPLCKTSKVSEYLEQVEYWLKVRTKTLDPRQDSNRFQHPFELSHPRYP